MSRARLICRMVPAMLAPVLGFAAEQHPSTLDQVMPAYGAAHEKPYYVQSSVSGLYQEITKTAANVESLALSGGALGTSIENLTALANKLQTAEAALVNPNYLERWHLDAAHSELLHAVGQLNLAGRLTPS